MLSEKALNSCPTVLRRCGGQLGLRSHVSWELGARTDLLVCGEILDYGALGFW